MFTGLFQPMHLILILGIALLVFGPGKLGGLGKDLGKGFREFRQALTEDKEIVVTPQAREGAAVRKENA
jgi:sec-independent protein translocase protein TatA